MYGIKKQVQMRYYLEQGLSKTTTARLLGVSRRTIYNWIEAGELERDPDDMTLMYGPRAPRPSKIDPFKTYIERCLSDYPQLAVARIFREIQKEGYPGGYGQVKRYVRDLRENEANGQRPDL